MKCNKPTDIGGLFVRCGKCQGCRVTRQEQTCLRIVMETASTDFALFLTFTYREADCPDSLVYSDIQEFLRRARFLSAGRIRFWVVGEYGSEKGRPHWHMLFFYKGADCPTKQWLETQWQKGFVDIDPRPVTAKTARYLMKYLHKDSRTGVKLFARQSLKPGLGYYGLRAIGKELAGRNFGVMPAYINIGGKSYPLDEMAKRYLEYGMLDREKTDYEKAQLYDLFGVPRRVLRSSEIYDPVLVQKRFDELVARRIKGDDPFWRNLKKMHGKRGYGQKKEAAQPQNKA